MDYDIPNVNIESYRQKASDITSQLQDPAIMSDYLLLGDLNSELKQIEEIINLWENIESNINEYEQNNSLLLDPEMEEMAKEEIARLDKQILKEIELLRSLTVVKLPNDNNNAIVEIRAGTGGTEASLFAQEIMRMYTRFVNSQGFSTEQISTTYNEEGGIKESVFGVNGRNAYGKLRFESGVHRVQRVPSTESSGRIHTSAVSIAIIPEIKTEEVDIKDSDLKIETFRSSGPGGQSVNTTDSAVRITHLPSGITVSCQDGKSQHKNREKAMSVLSAKLYEIEQEKAQGEANEIRTSAIKTGDRSAKIRTYNFPQGRITDHRTKDTWYNLTEALEGNITEIVESVNLKLRQQIQDDIETST